MSVVNISESILEIPIITWLTVVVILIWGLRIFIKKPSLKVFLIDFACYKAPPSQMCTKENTLQILKLLGDYSLDKMRKRIDKVGLGDSTYWPDCTFRVGGAAMLLSNRLSHTNSSKYELLHDVNIHGGSSDRSYKSIFYEEDDDGFVGVSITTDLLIAATNAIETNLTSLGPLILPISEKVLFFRNMIMRRIFGIDRIKRYIPNFTNAGGLPILNQLQRILGSSDLAMEASKITLKRFGNTSTSSTWYELAYSEAKGRIKKGDRIWQMAYGSGFKCSSVIWRAIRDVDRNDMKNAWNEESDALIHLNLDTDIPHDYFEPPK